MGKSKKKNKIITDSCKAAKKLSHQRFRNKTKNKIRQGRFDELPEFEREVTNQYDIIDHRYIYDKDLEDFYKDKFDMDESELKSEKRKFTNK